MAALMSILLALAVPAWAWDAGAQAAAEYTVETLYQGDNLTDAVPYEIAADPTSSSRFFISEPKTSAIYIWDSSSSDSALQLYAGKPHAPGWQDGPRATAMFSRTGALCVSPGSHVFVLDHASTYVVLRRIDAHTGRVSTVAGNVTHLPDIKDGTGSSALLSMGALGLTCITDEAVVLTDNSRHGAIRIARPAKPVGPAYPPPAGPSGDGGGGAGTGSGWVPAWVQTVLLVVSCVAVGAAANSGFHRYGSRVRRAMSGQKWDGPRGRGLIQERTQLLALEHGDLLDAGTESGTVGPVAVADLLSLEDDSGVVGAGSTVPGTLPGTLPGRATGGAAASDV